LDRPLERKTVTSGDSDDLCTVAAANGSNGNATFSRSRRWHPRTPRQCSAYLAHGDAAPVISALLPTFRCESTAGNGGCL
jgi:hypothetical protein